jgi:hypothetical protein
MTTNASRLMEGKWAGIARQDARTIFPARLSLISSSTTSPRMHARLRTHTVTKYAPAVA